MNVETHKSNTTWTENSIEKKKPENDQKIFFFRTNQRKKTGDWSTQSPFTTGDIQTNIKWLNPLCMLI